MAARRAKERIIRMAKKKQMQVMPQTLEAAAYVFVLATVAATTFDTETVLELYRARWQVELAFKRLKSLMQAGHVPKYDEASARAWIQAKLLAVLLIERLQEEAYFFPRGAFRSIVRSAWREFLESRDSVLSVLSMPLSPTSLIKHGRQMAALLAERSRTRHVQVARVCHRGVF